MKKPLSSLFLVFCCLYSQNARADLAAIKAAEQSVINAIVADVNVLSTFAAGIKAKVNAYVAANVQYVAQAAQQAAAAVYTDQVAAATADATFTQQAQSYLAGQLNNILGWLNGVATYQPWNYAAAYAQAVAYYADLQRQAANWLNAQYAAVQNWYNAVTAPIYAWYNGIHDQAVANINAAEQAGDAQIAQATQIVAAQVKPLQDELAQLQAAEAVANCPFQAHAPIVACSVVAQTAGGTDTFVAISTPQGNRTFRLFIPAKISLPAPLLLDYHGLTGNGLIQRSFSHFDTYASAIGFLLIEPDGVDASWNAGSCCGGARAANIDDVDFTRRIIDLIRSYGVLDTSRVFAAGLSNGGMMAQRLACELSEDIAAVATIVGPDGQYESVGGPELYSCKMRRPVPILMAYGTADTCVLFNGGPSPVCPVTTIPVFKTFEVWSKNNGCGDASRVVMGQSGASVGYRNPSCTSDRDVNLIVVNGGGHEWFGPKYGIDASALIIQFFAAHPMGAISSTSVTDESAGAGAPTDFDQQMSTTHVLEPQS